MNSRIILAIIVVFSGITFSMIPFQQLTVLPTSIQEAQANPCANEISRGGSADNAFNPQDDDERECEFTGYFDFEEDIDSEDIPPAQPFTISGTLLGTLTCEGMEAIPGGLVIDLMGEDGGTVTGLVRFTFAGTTITIGINDGTTDGNTFSLSGVSFACGGAEPVTISGDCGNDVIVSWEEPGGSGTFTGDVECTLL